MMFISRTFLSLFAQDKSSLTQEEITKLYFEKANLLPQLFADMECSTLNNLRAFRARIISPDEDSSLITTFSYPHPVICNRNGRANIAYKPVFYCSDNSITALLEHKPKVGDIIYLSVWNVRCNRKILYSSYINPTIKPNNPWYKHGQYVSAFQIEKAKKYGGGKEKELQLLYEFNSQLFIEQENDYPLTSWLAHQSLYQTDGVDFIVYPSNMTDAYTCNLAFHPNFVDKFFVFDRAYRLHYDSRIEDEVNFTPQKVGKVKRTHIEWSDITEEDADILPGMTKKV